MGPNTALTLTHIGEVGGATLMTGAVSEERRLLAVAPSGAGKNRAVDAARELFPPESIHFVSAASPRALVYDEADFSHRTVVFAEADSIPDDGPAGSAIRALAADNVLRYDVVESVPGRAQQFRTRHINKPGPTGLITTSPTSAVF